MPERVALINLGCPKNLVDSEVMLGQLRAQGYELSTDLDTADVVVVNTCGFLEASTQESIDTLLRMARRKRRGRLRAVVAAGCMTQRYGGEIMSAMPEVDGFLGVGQAQALPDVVRKVLSGERTSALSGPSAGFEGYGLRFQSTASHTAYLKISEGCDRHCSFCIIPAIRGPMVSQPIEQLVAQARSLVSAGTRELILIGQDPSRFGLDQGAGHQLPQLLEELDALPHLRWIRLMYLFPDRHAKDVIDAIARLPKVCKYLDMPLQHADAAVLRGMNRPPWAQESLGLMRNLREACPDASIRSTFIVGFPGESAESFDGLLGFLREAELDWVGAFRFSREAGTAGAELLEQVPARVRQRRYDRLMTLQQRITRKRLNRRVGRHAEVVIERILGDQGIGRTSGQAPEIDGETHVDLAALPETRPGDFVLAEITGAGDYDLQARALELLHRAPSGAGLVQIGVTKR
jgi:ribosomal protein S12 methylthiotransferase